MFANILSRREKGKKHFLKERFSRGIKTREAVSEESGPVRKKI